MTGGCLLLNESSAESSCMSLSFLHYFHAAISNHLSEKPKIYMHYFMWSLNTGLTVYSSYPMVSYIKEIGIGLRENLFSAFPIIVYGLYGLGINEEECLTDMVRCNSLWVDQVGSHKKRPALTCQTRPLDFGLLVGVISPKQVPVKS